MAMKKILLTEAERKAIIAEKEKAIIESFKSTFNKIKRIDENMLDETEMLDEGLKQWLIGGLITLSTLGGVGKIYQLNQEKAANHQIEMKYYNDVLSNSLGKMSKEDLASLGTNINEKTHDLALARNFSAEELNNAFSNYATKYIQSHAKEFGVDANGMVHWLK